MFTHVNMAGCYSTMESQLSSTEAVCDMYNNKYEKWIERT